MLLKYSKDCSFCYNIYVVYFLVYRLFLLMHVITTFCNISTNSFMLTCFYAFHFSTILVLRRNKTV